MKNYQSIMKEIDKRLTYQQPQKSFGGVMGRSTQKNTPKQNDVIDSLAGYVNAIRKTKEELLKNGNE